MLNKRFKEYFNFTKKERNGIIVLLLILVTLIGINIYIKNLSKGNVILISEEFQKEIEQFENSLELKDKKSKEFNFNKLKEKNKEKVALFDFDPNKIEKEDLINLGFTKRQVNTLINYREKGGWFNTKEDLLKVYGIDTVFYLKLEPFIKIEDKPVINDSVQINTIEKVELIELNTASVEELISLPGIGESYANKIINYRELLRGYYNKEQLLEVYGFDSTKYLKIKDFVKVDTTLINPININAAKYKTIIRHPYLNKYQTNSIMKYRELSGKFDDLEQLIKFNVLNREEYLKVKPYLITDTLYKSLTSE